MSEQDRHVKVLIPDTIGHGPLHEAFTAPFHGRHEFLFDAPAGHKRGKQHSHAGWTAWRMLTCLPPGIRVTLLFYRLMDEDGRSIPNYIDHYFGAWRDFGPNFTIKPSGAHAGGNELLEMFYAQRFGVDYQKRLNKQIEDYPCDLILPTGNSGDHDPKTNDLDFPQRMSANEFIHLIGMCNADGVPHPKSGDGPKVDCMYIGAGMISQDPFKAKRVTWDGTSGSVGGCGGSAIVLGLSGGKLKAYWRDHTTLMRGWPRGKRSLKAGYGSMAWHEAACLRKAGFYAQQIPESTAEIKAFDYRILRENP